MKRFFSWLTAAVLTLSCLSVPAYGLKDIGSLGTTDPETGNWVVTQIQVLNDQGKEVWIDVYDEQGNKKWVEVCTQEGEFEWLPVEEAPTEQELLQQAQELEAALESRFGVKIVNDIPNCAASEWLWRLFRLEEDMEAIPATLWENARARLAAKGKTLTIRLDENDDVYGGTGGTYDPGTVTIRLYYTGIDIFAHEYGHMLHLTLLNAQYGSNSLKSRWTALNQGTEYGNYDEAVFVTDYGATKYEEDVAECASYLLAGGTPVQTVTLNHPGSAVEEKLLLLRSLLAESFSVPLSEFPDIYSPKPSSWAAEGVSEYEETFFYGVFATYGQPFAAGYQNGATRGDFAAAAYDLANYVWSTRKYGGLGFDCWSEYYPQYPYSELQERNPFWDVTSYVENWESIIKLYLMGVIAGKSEHQFDPDGQITRQEAAVMLARLCRALSYDLPVGEDQEFTDGEQFASWAEADIRAVAAAGIMTGTGNGQFSPTELYSNEQTILTIMRLYHLLLDQA